VAIAERYVLHRSMFLSLGSILVLWVLLPAGDIPFETPPAAAAAAPIIIIETSSGEGISGEAAFCCSA
jgi:hypothetical protein